MLDEVASSHSGEWRGRRGGRLGVRHPHLVLGFGGNVSRHFYNFSTFINLLQ